MHDDEPANGHAHCQHLFLGASETVPIHEGAARLGQWQTLFLVELDHDDILATTALEEIVAAFEELLGVIIGGQVADNSNFQRGFASNKYSGNIRQSFF